MKKLTPFEIEYLHTMLDIQKAKILKDMQNSKDVRDYEITLNIIKTIRDKLIIPELG
jgi:hypothetical protein